MRTSFLTLSRRTRVTVEGEMEKAGSKPVVNPGEAVIKPEYIVKRNASKDGEVGTELKQEQSIVADETEQTGDGNGPPPTKRRKKERGQNKRRPRAARVDHADQLCPSLYHGDRSNRFCQFGDKCHYCHDCSEFLAKKPPDIAESCHLFTKLGRCPYGLSCRYGNSHMTPDHQNSINEDLFDPDRADTTINIITRSLQENLRKKRVELPKSEKFLEEFEKKGVRNKQKSCELEEGGSGRKGEKEEGEGVKEEGEKGKGEGEGGVKDRERGREGTIGNGATDEVKEEPANPEGREVDEASGKREPSETASEPSLPVAGAVTDEDTVSLRPEERKKIDFRGKLYLAPLTTVGNLPFRRICKEFGADITCGEMAMATNLLQGQQSEWALLKRHASEDVFGVQVCGAHVDSMTRCAEVVSTHTEVDFIDVNVGCPIDLVCNKGAGCSLMERRTRFESIVRGMTAVVSCPVTVKMRTGVHHRNWNAHKLLPRLRDWGVAMATVHGRSREQRYTKLADWGYISQCAAAASPLPVFGCGDILSFQDYEQYTQGQAGIMIARGALIKPWIFTEIKERRHWDISSSERLEILKRYADYGLEHWGSDTIGVENTRKFLLEWLSFLYRYIPVGLLERVPQKINERPPLYHGRDELETLMASHYCNDWIKISEMLLGPVPSNFTFLPKHKANSYL